MAKILFPTDFSETANNAYLYALHLAKKIQAEILLVSVQSNLKNYLDITASDFNQYINQLNELAKTHNLEQIKVESSMVIGDLLLTILDFVEKEDVQYIVMGTNGQNSLGKKVFGSNTLNVLNNATVPVLTVPNKAQFHEKRTFAYATMFHESENKSLNEMIEIANRYQQELQIVHVENMLLTNEMLRVKDEWENKYPQAKIKIIKSQNIENGLLNYCTENKIDVLGIVHREMSVFERLFAINHSKRLLSNENVALLVFHESK